jgi:hypothetical protein
MKRNLFIIAFAGSVFFLVSCKKGDDGPPGTANVKYSEWFIADPWKKDTVFNVWGFNYIKDAAGITQDILDDGTVLTFAKLEGYNALIWPRDQVGQLPISLTYQSGIVMTDTWAATATLGKLKIRFVNDNNTYNTISNAHQFRYVIIPGGLPADGRSSLSYHDICRMYNIPE